MDVMVLAAGRGTRLGPLGLRVPKALVELAGEPLLGRHLRYLAGQGVSRVVVNAHHLAEQVRDFARAYAGPLELEVVEERELLGTAGGVRNALSLLRGSAFVVLYGDVLVEQPLGPMLETHRATGAAATLACYWAESTEGKGVVEVDARDMATGFREKDPARTGPGLVNAGLYVLDRDVVEPLPPGRFLDFGFDVLPALLTRDGGVAVHRLAEPVVDVGTPEALALARRLLATG